MLGNTSRMAPQANKPTGELEDDPIYNQEDGGPIRNLYDTRVSKKSAMKSKTGLSSKLTQLSASSSRAQPSVSKSDQQNSSWPPPPKSPSHNLPFARMYAGAWMLSPSDGRGPEWVGLTKGGAAPALVVKRFGEVPPNLIIPFDSIEKCLVRTLLSSNEFLPFHSSFGFEICALLS